MGRVAAFFRRTHNSDLESYVGENCSNATRAVSRITLFIEPRPELLLPSRFILNHLNAGSITPLGKQRAIRSQP